MGYPQYPTLKKPEYTETEIPTRVDELKRNSWQEIGKFLNGAYDPTASQFNSYWDVYDTQNQKSTNKMIQQILSAQGGQRIYGGAAGQQVRETLLDKDTNDLLARREMLMNMINNITSNRQFGIGAAESTVGNERNYQSNQAQMKNSFNMNLANMENDWNTGYYDAMVNRYQYRRANANTIRNWLPTIMAGAESATQAAVGMQMAGSMGGSKFGGMNQYSGAPAKYSTSMPASAYGGYNVGGW